MGIKILKGESLQMVQTMMTLNQTHDGKLEEKLFVGQPFSNWNGFLGKDHGIPGKCTAVSLTQPDLLIAAHVAQRKVMRKSPQI